MDATERARAFRIALGAFATGVTIVTTRGRDGQPVGVTASSFNSVSVDPPLILWSLARSSRSHDDFCAGEHFAIHVLTTKQAELSNRFATSGEDKFRGIDWTEGLGGTPILPGSAALFECRMTHRHEGGDHIILVGEVLAFERFDHAPLLFHGGRYAEARQRPAGSGTVETVDLETASFSDEFLLYLLGRAHYQIARASRKVLAAKGLGDREYVVFGRLSMATPIPAAMLIAQMEHCGLGIDSVLIDQMRADGLIEDCPGGLRMSSAAKATFLDALTTAKEQEEALLVGFSPGEAAELRRLLRRLIDASGADVPIAWRG